MRCGGGGGGGGGGWGVEMDTLNFIYHLNVHLATVTPTGEPGECVSPLEPHFNLLCINTWISDAVSTQLRLLIKVWPW